MARSKPKPEAPDMSLRASLVRRTRVEITVVSSNMDLKDPHLIKITKEMTDTKNRANKMLIILTKEAQQITIASSIPSITAKVEMNSKFSQRIALNFEIIDQRRQVQSLIPEVIMVLKTL
jgi:hypothetical protein